ncbi:ExbD/TolR family protein [Desulfosarcina sp. OttesenSCG-928-A07]|nr:ExbD/TolR family protein [Desulfosarcina sp. OttesenSCG-928-G17]MDL2329646.1 ExbD/TolR family protein [Desulfosarcina sp. OttesenSCG-928-A07]
MQQIQSDLASDADFGVMSEINVTPFIDVMLVLLIIFMVTAPLMMASIPLNLPKGAMTRLEQMNAKPLIVSIDGEKRIYVGKEEVTAQDHDAFFKELALTSEDGGVHVRGDKDIPYGDMVNLMAKLGKAGFARVVLVTESGKSETNPVTPDSANSPSPLTGKKTALVSASSQVHTPGRP